MYGKTRAFHPEPCETVYYNQVNNKRTETCSYVFILKRFNIHIQSILYPVIQAFNKGLRIPSHFLATCAVTCKRYVPRNGHEIQNRSFTEANNLIHVTYKTQELKVIF